MTSNAASAEESCDDLEDNISYTRLLIAKGLRVLSAEKFREQDSSEARLFHAVLCLTLGHFT